MSNDKSEGYRYSNKLDDRISDKPASPKEIADMIEKKQLKQAGIIKTTGYIGLG